MINFCHINFFSERERGHNSAGRVQASQAWSREFESRCPLHVKSAFLILKGHVGVAVFMWFDFNSLTVGIMN